MKKIPREIVGILFYFILCFGIDYLFSSFPNSTSFFIQNLEKIPKIQAFFFLFLIQEIILLFFMIISLKISLGKSTKILPYFYSKFNWLGWKKLFKYVFGSFFIYIFIISVLYSILSTLNINLPGFFGEQSISSILEKLNQPGIINTLLIIFTVAILGPIVEEIIYRGYITDILIKKIGKIWGILISSFLFAFVHMEFSVLGNLFILALILSYIYYKTESLRYSFAFHLLINGLGVLVLFM